MPITLFIVIYKQLRFLLLRKYKIQLVILILLAILLSLIETAAVSIIMPFISLATNQSLINGDIYKTLFDFFHFTDEKGFIITFGFIIMGFYLFRAVYTVAYTYILAGFSYGVFRSFSQRLFTTYLNLPYITYIQHNSSELTQHIISESVNTGILLFNVTQLFSEFFTILLLYSLMIIMNWQMTLIVTVLLLVIVFTVSSTILPLSKRKGISRADAYKELYKIIGETFGNFKFIRLKGTVDIIGNEFGKITKKIAQLHTLNNVLNIMPRCILESFGFILIVGMINFILWRYQKPDTIITVISMYALSLYRILPASTRLMANMNNMMFFQRSLELVYHDVLLKTETEGSVQVIFNKAIVIENLSFSYVKEKTILKDISLAIKKGEKIAVVGGSGGGKSTLIDLLIGIHKSTGEYLFVDGIPITDANVRSWRSKIGYIPQEIYLFDGTVGENVSFGSVMNENRVIEVLKLANIWDFLQEREGFNTKVGEKGITLSGGQKQRIGIARALYHNPEILVLDEATSALDSDTEEKIMDEIYNLSKDKTLIVIAHRLTTIERCDRRILIENGAIQE